ncbi:U2 small nuclear ribonucleoprotein auxiliary factor 35 kDa subunit-related protein 2-like isoform X3 [Portunus trituberculatus]|uniref:U2 small nuclear ribonucleoprotein auxiliary factor 35 kDa subunit-related protein 2-like isoform X3 n=1 Tax=Portunus trituberculatus TaxID=210409 RepID=UPI001E1CF56B|nr:U2 small nuclear ribonucleoprotein auxiliary factor 35 kDa subunit-related protein 2-like isoform X3 [Portunus trituberculatus]
MQCVNGVHGSKCPMLKKKKCGQDSWLLHHCITMLIELTKRVSHKVWRQIVKRERRRRIRQKTAQELHLKHQEEQAALMQDPSYREELERLWIMEEETWRLEEEEAHRRKEEWQLRDAALHSKFLNEKCKREFQEEQKKKQEEMIKKEWEEKQKMEEEDKKKKEQEALLKAATDSLGKQGEQPTHNPEPPVGYNRRDLTPPRREPCPFFNKTGTCRFGVQCSRDHVYPERSSTILLPNMYTYFGMEHLAVEEKDSDIGLEYSESEIYQHFRDFFEDVLPEFQRCGKVLQFKVCSNASPHLRGNVYVQFLSEEDAGRACALFNGRWYAGRQLTCYLVTIEKWKSALCGLYWRKQCPKGGHCNFLHAYRNPGNAFWQADKDMQPLANSSKTTYRKMPSSKSSRSRHERSSEASSDRRQSFHNYEDNRHERAASLLSEDLFHRSRTEGRSALQRSDQSESCGRSGRSERFVSGVDKTNRSYMSGSKSDTSRNRSRRSRSKSRSRNKSQSRSKSIRFKRKSKRSRSKSKSQNSSRSESKSDSKKSRSHRSETYAKE